MGRLSQGARLILNQSKGRGRFCLSQTKYKIQTVSMLAAGPPWICNESPAHSLHGRVGYTEDKVKPRRELPILSLQISCSANSYCWVTDNAWRYVYRATGQLSAFALKAGHLMKNDANDLLRCCYSHRISEGRTNYIGLAHFKIAPVQCTQSALEPAPML